MRRQEARSIPDQICCFCGERFDFHAVGEFWHTYGDLDVCGSCHDEHWEQLPEEVRHSEFERAYAQKRAKAAQQAAFDSREFPTPAALADELPGWGSQVPDFLNN
jgi:hypothetical protein